MLFVCYPKCSTCAKARKWLEEQEISFDERDIKTDNPTEAELRDWHRRSGLPLKRFFNTSGLQYKALGLKDRLPEMSEDEQYALLATDGMLVKRPLLIGEDFALPGFREKEWLRRNGISNRFTRSTSSGQFLFRYSQKRVDIRRLILYNKSCLSGKTRNGIEAVITRRS